MGDGPLTPTDALKRVGFTFRLSSLGIFATPSWDVGPAVFNDAVNFLSSTTLFRVRTALPRGSCGSAIIGRDGTLAGIIHKRINGSDKEAIVIGPATIRAAIESVK